jgi:hypothetical protein
MRSRRSNSTATETLPAISLRTTVSPRRRIPAPVIARTSGSTASRSVVPSPVMSIASTVWPTSQGIATVIAIAPQANTSDQITVRRYGRRNPSNRQNVLKTWPSRLPLYEVK